MDKIVSNATPLIYLAKADKLYLLEATINEVFIPNAVFKEVVEAGKRLGEKDAYRVEKAISQGWLVVQAVKNMFSLEVSLHPGEIEVISLAREKGIKTVLMDDAKGRSVAELGGLKLVGTLWIILQAVKNRIIDFNEFLSALEDIIHSGFYLKDEVYIKIIRTAKSISEE